MRLAIIADIHGNLPALEAVLADMRRHAADLTLDLGDCVSGPLWPLETGERLAGLAFPTVRGNHDRELAETPRALMGASDAYAFDHMTGAHRERLGRLPLTLTLVEGVLAFHGTPTDDAVYLLEDIVGGRMAVATPANVVKRLGVARAPLMLCGHTHQARVVSGPDGCIIVNPGSVGLPAAVGDDHVSETGSTHARYALATRGPDKRWAIEFFAIEYDWRPAASLAAKNGRPDWAHALATGYALRD